VVTTIAGRVGEFGHRDGPAADALFFVPFDLALDAAGNLWIADSGSFGGGNHVIRKLTPGGVVSTPVGNPGVIGSDDGAGFSALFNFPSGVAVDSRGRVYVADALNDSIREITPTLPDKALIDERFGVVGNTRVLDTAPSSATSWEWNLVRRPAGSTATLSATSVRNPTFTPDVGDLYVFRVIARGPAGASITFTELHAEPTMPRRRAVRH